MKFTFTVVIISLIISRPAISQCVSPTAPPVIACGTGTPLASGATINSGETYSYNGSGGSFSNITVNGGTLLLCGIVTITNINVNSGNLVINTGTTATFNGNFNAGGHNFFNAGTAIFNLNVAVQGSMLAYNAAGASLTVNGTLAVFNSGLFINNGTAMANDIILNSGASICLGPSSTSQVASITSNQSNAVTVPAGIACLSYTTTFGGNAAITATPNLHICQATGASAPVPIALGSATLVTNCTSCTALFASLPVTLMSFRGRHLQDKAVLEWKTASEDNVQSFIIERRTTGSGFIAIGEISANNRPSTYSFHVQMEEESDFRLKMTDLDGHFTYSPTLRLRPVTHRMQVSLLTNPVIKPYAELTITVARNQNGELRLMDNMGRLVKRKSVSLVKGSNSIRFELQGVQQGRYYLHFTGPLEKSKPVSLVKI